MESASKKHDKTNSMEGWIKLHYKLLEWEWHDDPAMFSLWIHLLLLANYEDKKWHGMVIERGKFVTSLVNLHLQTGLSIRQVRTCLSRLQESKQIECETTNKYTIVTICNFDDYQNRKGGQRQTNDNPTTNEGQSNDNPTTTTKEYKNNKEDKNNIPSSNEDVSVAPAPDPESDQEKVDLVGLKNFFNMTMNQAGAIIPRCKSCGGKRAGYVKARIREYGLDSVYEMISKASVSDFLNGKNDRGWKANFEWLFLPTNFPKVLEGIYDNKSIQHNNGNNQSYRKSIAEQQRERLQSECEAIVSRRLAEDNAY